MSAFDTCEGCGAFTAAGTQFEKRGLAKRSFYCGDCVSIVDAYLEARDKLHTNVAKAWEEGLTELREDFGGQLSRGSLPDG